MGKQIVQREFDAQEIGVFTSTVPDSEPGLS
jgi:hypothetical protein